MKKQWFILTVVGLLVLVACGPLQQPAKPDQVVLQLKWLHNPQFSGFYMAQEKGYYAEENIEVSYTVGGSNVDVIGNVVSGQAHFGIWLGERLLKARHDGQPVKAIASIFQINPTAYFSLAQEGIKEPADLAGKRIAFSKDRDFVLPALLQTAGLTLDDVEYYPINFDFTPLVNGEVDVWTGYLINEVVTLQEQGQQVNFIMPDDYGLHIYSDVLFTTDTLVKDNPDLVQRFVRASLRGWKYALQHPDEAVAVTAKLDPTLDLDHAKGVMNALIPLVDTGQLPVGMMDESVWQSTQDIMLESGIISSPVDLTTLYTNEFMNKTQ